MKKIDWTEIIYSIFLLAIVLGFFYWVYYSHINSPCNKKPIPEEYRTQCLTGYK